MTSPLLYSPGTRSAGLLHLSPLIPTSVAAVAVGRPLGWIGFLLPAGPLLAVAAAHLAGRTPVPTWRLVLAFSLVGAVMIGGSWSLMRLGDAVPPLALLFPLALLAFLLGLVNVVLVCVSRAWRAWRSIPLHYPWIPGWLGEPLGIDPTLKER